MDPTEQNADPGQADTGQPDAGATGGQPYADYLTRVPEEVRGEIEPIFKDWNSSVNGRFQEHAEYRKGWEPYEQFRQHDPAAIQNALQLYEVAANDPKQFQQWFQEYASERGLTPAEAQAQLEQQPESFEAYDPSTQFNQLLEQKLTPLEQRLQALLERDEAREKASQEASIQKAIDHEIGVLKAEHAKNLPEKVQEQIGDIIERFGSKYAQQPGATPQWVVQQAWADFQAISNQLQTGALQGKLDQPEPPLTGDMADGAPPQIRTLQEANKIAKEQIRASRTA